MASGTERRQESKEVNHGEESNNSTETQDQSERGDQKKHTAPENPRRYLSNSTYAGCLFHSCSI